MSAQRHAGERNTGERHPDAAALAEYREGLARGLRGRRLAAHVASCPRCASVSNQLAAVSSTLASAPTPELPDAVTRRITAALAAEAALRTEAAPAAHAASTAAVGPEAAASEPVPTGATTGPRPPRRARGRRWLRPAVLASAAAACVVLFGGLYLLNVVRFSAGSSSSSAASGSKSSPVSGAAAAPVPAAGNAGGPLGGRAAGTPLKTVFTITTTGIRYEPATLAAQVRAQLAANSAEHTQPSPGNAPLASPNTPGAVPSTTVTACVLHLTGQMRPSLVDRATYAGEPVYVIAVPDHVWVAGRDCTASDPHLIASIRL